MWSYLADVAPARSGFALGAVVIFCLCVTVVLAAVVGLVIFLVRRSRRQQ